MEFIPKKERLKLPTTKLTKPSLKERISSNTSTYNIFSLEAAQKEASRCLQCSKPGCVAACPFGNDIPGFLKAVVEGNLEEASKILRKTSSCAAVCSRVCPHDDVCVGNCILAKASPQKEGLQIGAVETYITEYEIATQKSKIKTAPKNGKKVALIGGGPAGFGAAMQLLVLGYDVDIYDENNHPGGLLDFGLPSFRLPRHAVEFELKRVFDAGANFIPNKSLGKDFSLDDLKKSYSAVMLGIGNSVSMSLNIEGKDAKGILSAISLLKEYNTFLELDDAKNSELGKRFKGKNVAVFGAGDTAMDTARVAVRLGANVNLYYRRTIEEAPALKEDLLVTQEEYVTFNFLTNPKRFINDKDSNLIGVEVEKMELGEKDSSGRCSPQGTGELRVVDADIAILSLGFYNDEDLLKSLNIKMTSKGLIELDENRMTSIAGVFAAGDAAGDVGAVSRAAGAAIHTANKIHEYISNQENIEK